ncbi:hypothetical protein LHV18_20935 [Providencia rettgeri]|uniref:hypothetical protein n=1 Tax=Providencia TaxID=586 RepID=UPI001CFD455C|nr:MULTISPECIES: hypothetical protein [Providencia]EIU7558059.1 hypothetical protein [Providencia rettgeri]MCB4843081.1 hypothetical protein [Providencia rettgeri]MCG5276309.1 hypothetical protein [Providencia rettgeri]MCG9507167.1 hypothetical protein [Providencia rettgeri]
MSLSFRSNSFFFNVTIAIFSLLFISVSCGADNITDGKRLNNAEIVNLAKSSEVEQNSDAVHTKSQIETVSFPYFEGLQNELEERRISTFSLPVGYFNADGIYRLQDKDKNSVITSINLPENGTNWGTLVVSIVAIAISIGIPVVQSIIKARASKKDKISSMNDGFWMREVFIPNINRLSTEIANKTKESLCYKQSDFLRCFEDEILTKLEELRQSIQLISNVNNQLDDHINELLDICDNFENDVDNHQESDIKIRKQDVIDFYSNLTRGLLGLHKKLLYSIM